MTKPRDYDKEYREFQGKPEQIANRSSRNKARRKMVKAGRVSKGDGMDVDHKNGNPKQNHAGNLQVLSKSANRSKK